VNHLDPTQIEQLKEIGAHLKQHRQSLSISLEEVAKQTFIPLHILQALEVGESDRLPEAVYIQGFIRRYADVLKLDGVTLANSFPTSIFLVKSETSNPEESESVGSVLPVQYYDSSNEEEPKTLSSKSPVKSGIINLVKLRGGTNNVLLYLTYIFLMVAASSTLFYLLRTQQTPSPDTAQLRKVTEKTKQEEQRKQESRGTEGVGEQESRKRDNNADSSSIAPSPNIETQESPSPNIQTQESPSPEPQKTVATPSEPTESIELTVSLDGDSWLRVIIDGKTEFEGILTQGDKKTWSAKEQLIIKAGNAGAVMTSLNQQEAKPLGAVGAVEEVTFSN